MRRNKSLRSKSNKFDQILIVTLEVTVYARALELKN